MRHRLRNYCADCSLHFNELGPGELAAHALHALRALHPLHPLHAPLAYKPGESNGAARAAREIVSVRENRAWATG